jgi:hypothetical protein
MTGNKQQRQVVDKKAKSGNKGPMTEEEIAFKKKQQEEQKALKAAAANMKGKKK